MDIVEVQESGGKVNKTNCDFCGEEPENGVLYEKPASMIVRGELVLSQRNQLLFVCLECLEMEGENM